MTPGRNSLPILRLVSAQLFGHACTVGMRLASPLLALATGHGPMQVGMLVAANAVGSVLLAVPQGRWVQRHGLRKPWRWSVAVGTLGAAAAALWPVFGVLCVSAMLCGAASSLYAIAVQRHVGLGATDSRQRRHYFGWLSLAAPIANFAGPLLAGVLIDHAGAAPRDLGAFRITYAVLALLPLVSLVLILPVRELPRPADAGGGKPGPTWDLLRSAPIRRLLMINGVSQSCWDVHTFAVPILAYRLGLSSVTIGAILGAFALSSAAIRPILQQLTGNAPDRRVFTVTLSLTAVWLALYPLTTGAWSMGLLSSLLGFTLGAMQPTVLNALHHVTSISRYGEALGLRMMTVNATSTVLPLLFGSASGLLGLAGLFWVVAVGMGGCVVLAQSLEDREN